MSKSSPRLGKGLGAILGKPRAELDALQRPEPSSAPEGQVKSLPIDQLIPNRNQPRTHFDDSSLRELSDSIRTSGVLQPVLVRKASDQKYELVAGERRWRAARVAGLKHVPALVRELNDAEALELALVENLQREDLNPMERAAAYRRYLDAFGGSADDLAGRLGESRASVANYLRLLKLSDEVRALVDAGELSMGHARALLSVSDPQRQIAAARLAVRRNLSVRQVESLCKEPDVEPGTVVSGGRPLRDQHVVDLERSLSKSMGLSVRVQPGKRKNAGRVVIQYANLDQFDMIAERIAGRSNLE